MKNLLFGLLGFALFFSCNQTTKPIDNKVKTNEIARPIYPDNITKVFDTHGGLDTWNAFESLYFEIEKPNINDAYNVALKSRESLIRMEHHNLGFDGEKVWVQNLDTSQYKGNAKFYYNLMFYFYAMPYVLGDDGINYEDVDPISFEGKEYPGIKISYDAGVGTSSDDEYVLYFDKDTHKMSWLAYTVTYFSKEKSKKFNLIKYDTWNVVAGIELPKKIQWYIFKDGIIEGADEDHGSVSFVNAKLSKEKPKDDLFKVPEDGTVIE